MDTTGTDTTEEYLTGQMRPHFPALMEAFQRDSDAIPPTAANVRYGPHPRQTFDFLQSQAPWRGTLAYFHAGYWQSRDKSLFRFIAPALMQHGLDMAMVGYPLCPDVTLPELVQATRAAIPAILAHAASAGRGGAGLVAAGHSAGGHIVAELALSDWAGASPIVGVAALSGVYDLEPLVGTPLNDKLRLNPATARAMSPLRRVRSGMPPALFAVGGLETAAFQRQNADMHAAWAAAGNPARCLVVDGADHFTLLRHLQRPGNLLAGIVGLVGSAAPM